MENPASWGAAEHIVNSVIEKHERNMVSRAPMIGASLPMQITTALRAAGLLYDENPVRATGLLDDENPVTADHVPE